MFNHLCNKHECIETGYFAHTQVSASEIVRHIFISFGFYVLVNSRSAYIVCAWRSLSCGRACRDAMATQSTKENMLLQRCRFSISLHLCDINKRKKLRRPTSHLMMRLDSFRKLTTHRGYRDMEDHVSISGRCAAPAPPLR